jgi:hypothetical protein
LRLATLLLSLPSLAGHWLLFLHAAPVARFVVVAWTTAFLTFLALVLLTQVLRDPVITSDTLVGAICVYFLMGVAWGAAYTFVDLTSPGAFRVSPDLAAAAGWSTRSTPVTPLLTYYSFATLSTLGYGDMSPLAPAARSLSILEGMSGPLYLAILIAHLVSLRATRVAR